jgi:hypothetical protein
MRKYLKAILVVGLAAAPIVACGPAVEAADLGVTTRVIHHQRLRLVRDYDGTPVIVHRGPAVAVRNYDGTSVIVHERYHQPVAGPQPHYYFNGQPVRSVYVLRRYYLAL